MSWDNSETIYHLTTSGWVPGEDPPPYRIESWVRSVSQASPYSKEYIGWRCLWADEKAPRAERDKLRKKHGEFMGRAGRLGSTITTIGEPI